MPDRIVSGSRWERQTSNIRLCLIADSGWRFLLYKIQTYAARTCPGRTADLTHCLSLSWAFSSVFITSGDVRRWNSAAAASVVTFNINGYSYQAMRAHTVCLNGSHTGNMQQNDTLITYDCVFLWRLPSFEQCGLWLSLIPFLPLPPLPPPPHSALTCNMWWVCRPHSGRLLFRRSMSTELSTAPCDTWRSWGGKWGHWL